MSTEQVLAFLKMLEDSKFKAAFEAATPEAKQELLTKAGLTISLAEAEAAFKGERELGEQELDKVAGGEGDGGGIGIIRYPPPPPGG